MISTIDICLISYDFQTNTPLIFLLGRDKNPFINQLALVGGFIFEDVDNDIKDTIKRILKNKMPNVANIELDNINDNYSMLTIGSQNRDPRGWSVSTIYLVFQPYLNIPKSELKNWFDINKVINNEINLAFDHNLIINKIYHLINQTPEHFNYLERLLTDGQEFTETQLRNGFQFLLNKHIDKKTFSSQLKKSSLYKSIVDTKQLTNTGLQARPARIFCYHKQN